ncbi:MAG: hypothetical protein HGA23_07175 [Bacteroidales bacterium]|nr:hypothetical protein [Bacteroidales bacterium]
MDGRWQAFGPLTVIVMPERHDHGFRFSRDVDGAVITLVSRRFPADYPGHAGLAEWLARPSLTRLPADHPDTPYLGETLDRAEREIVEGAARPATLVETMLTTALLLTMRMSGAERERREADRDRERFARLTDLVLIVGGPVTALPLFWFGIAATRIPLSTLGFIQYLSPTLQLMLGIFIFSEPFDTAYLVSFGLVWIGLGIYSYSVIKGMKQRMA